MRKAYKNRKILLISCISILLASVLCITFSYATDAIEDGTRVEAESELIYYIDVEYDGKDIEGVESNDDVTANIKSGYINVEDKLPEGLTFNGFVTTESGGIGAVKRSDNTSSCSGYVIGGVDGLYYDEVTRKVSFQVKSLGAGCKLTVGIKTKTPTVDDPSTTVVEERRDFYNTASAQEGLFSINSNTTHVFIGNPNTTLYKVIYEFEGEVPKGAIVPTTTQYIENQTVGVENNPTVEGYTFSGWKSDSVTITNGKFTMPARNVTLKGSFTKSTGYSVTYEIEGTIPEGYLVPDKKDYYPNSEVKVDSLKVGDEINGYRFLGWKTSDVEITNDNDFLMPQKNVTITGSFEEIKYNVTYKFQGAILPDNSESLLPEVKSYKPGEIVKLENITAPVGYRFLGWYKEDNFEMPTSDIVIYGEWGLQNGTFEPTITKVIMNPKKSYKKGDTVKFKITVTNNETYSLKDVIIKEVNKNATYIENNSYSLLTSRMVRIAEIPANESVEIFATYKIQNTDKELLSIETQLIGALADNNFYLNIDKEYIAVSKVKITTPSSNVNIPNTIDDIVKYVGLLVLGIASLGTCIIIFKKTKKKSK